jgi:hypothetical protein
VVAVFVTEISITAVGDINTGPGPQWKRNILPKKKLNSHNIINNPNGFISDDVRRYLNNSDLLFGNLEGIISDLYYDCDEDVNKKLI